MKHIVCTNVACKEVIGTISMVPVDIVHRPGILRSECKPSPMPTTCPKCNYALQRI